MTTEITKLVSQSEFARMKGVSRKTVSEWNTQRLLVFSGTLVDVLATQERLLTNASYRAKGRKRTVAIEGATPSPGVTFATPASYANRNDYGNPANLPEQVVTASVSISGGASDMARLLLPVLPITTVRSLVASWVEQQRDGIVGGPGQPATTADEEWPDPPIGFTHWREHRYFQGDPLQEEWHEIEQDHTAGRLPQVGA